MCDLRLFPPKLNLGHFWKVSCCIVALMRMMPGRFGRHLAPSPCSTNGSHGEMDQFVNLGGPENGSRNL